MFGSQRDANVPTENDQRIQYRFKGNLNFQNRKLTSDALLPPNPRTDLVNTHTRICSLLPDAAMTMLKGFSTSAPRVSIEQTEQELRNLSEKEQRLIHQDLYGDYQPHEETPLLLAEALRSMQAELEFLTVNGDTYQRALQICPDYATDQAFRLAFLRCERFIAKVSRERVRFVSRMFMA